MFKKSDVPTGTIFEYVSFWDHNVLFLMERIAGNDEWFNSDYICGHQILCSDPYRVKQNMDVCILSCVTKILHIPNVHK
jgi:hypothetical protein